MRTDHVERGRSSAGGRRQRPARARGARQPGATSPLRGRLLLLASLVVVGIIGVSLVGIVSRGPAGDALPAVVAPDVPPPAAELRLGRSLGDPDAPLHLEVFEDPQCPACGVFTTRIEPLLKAGPVARGEVLLTYRDMVFLGPESVDAAAAMRVAEALDGSFWPYHDVLYANQLEPETGGFSRDRLATMAEAVGLEREAFLAELEDPGYRAAVLAETADARALGVDRTPTLRIDGRLLVGVPSWPELEAMIDDALSTGRDPLSDDGGSNG